MPPRVRTPLKEKKNDLRMVVMVGRHCVDFKSNMEREILSDINNLRKLCNFRRLTWEQAKIYF